MPEISRSQFASAVGLAILVAAVAVFGVIAVPQLVGAEHSYVVLSDSMTPTFSAGSVVMVNEAPAGQVEEGDIITYNPPSGASNDAEGVDRVTHRVVGVVEQDGQRAFRTKGDANEEPDSQLVRPDDLIGVVMFSIPAVGYVVQFANSGNGILLLVVVPAILLALNEIWELYRAAVTTDGESDN